MSQKRLKQFQRALARYGLYSSAWLFRWLPFGVVRLIMHVLIAIAFRFTVKQKAIARESLAIALGQEKSPQEIDEIVGKCFRNLGRGMIEMVYYLSHPISAKNRITYEGREHLDNALKQGKGVVAVTAHFGNFPLMMLACAAEGYACSSIIRPARDEKLEAYLYKRRKDLGLKTVYALPRKTCVAQSLKALRDNDILFVPLDQNFGNDGGIFVEFFGQKAATATGPIVFAERTGAVILPMFIIREEGDRHRIIIEPPFELEKKETDQATLFANIARLTKLIEQYIRRYPHEWGWMHRRWKSRPSHLNLKAQRIQ